MAPTRQPRLLHPAASVAAAALAVVFAGCQPVVHGYRTGALTGVLVLAIVAVIVFYVMRHVHRST